MPTRVTRLVLPAGASTPARAFEIPHVAAPPGDDALATIHPPAARHDGLPVLLAGPILRYVTSHEVWVWIATSVPLHVDGFVRRPDHGHLGDDADCWAEVGRGAADTVSYGEQLHVAIVKIRAATQYPHTQILGYDLFFTTTDDHLFTDEGGLVARHDVAYGVLPIPTFFTGLGAGATSLHLLHGSCRKHHADGEDALAAADHELRAHATNPHERPAIMLHTGDQIYADDVDGSLLCGLSAAAGTLLGAHEWVPREPAGPDSPEADSLPTREWVHLNRVHAVRRWGLTVDEEYGEHHLFGFGEFAAMYLFSWSPDLWNVPYFRDQLGGFTRAREAAIARRVLANVPNYMMWDDHEITDDWPMTLNRRDRVRAHPCGAWLIANGMAAAFVFQLDGNGLERTEVKDALMPYLDSLRHLPEHPDAYERRQHAATTARYADAVVRARGFGFVTPTVPPILVLDTRTQRDLHGDTNGADSAAFPGLLDAAACDAIRRDVRASGRPEHAPLLVVSPAPVLGAALLERIQQRRSEGAIWWEEDPEAWSLDPNAFCSFLRTLRGLTSTVVFFSGDVHYGFFAEGCFSQTGYADLRIIQLTSTAFRNQASTALRVGENLVTSGWVAGFRRDDTRFVEASGSDAEMSLSWGFRPVTSLGGWDVAARVAFGIFTPGAGPVATSQATVYSENNCGIVRISWNGVGEATIMQRLAGAGESGFAVTSVVPGPGQSTTGGA